METHGRLRENTLVASGIDSKLRDYDRVKLSGHEVCHGHRDLARAIVLQEYTQRPVQFEITSPTRKAVEAWIKHAGLKSDEFPFPSRYTSPHPGSPAVRTHCHYLGEGVGQEQPIAYATFHLPRSIRSAEAGIPGNRNTGWGSSAGST
ncbi:MAG: hypothetical protein ACREYE_01950 [Gammaproteobacteria bacterium]